MLLDVAVVVVAQVALVVRMQETISPFVNVLLVYAELLVPTFTPFTCHWYDGAEPPFAGVAVKVTDVPGQTLLPEAAILTEGIAVVETTIVILLDVTEVVEAQVASLVRIQETTSPFAKILLE